MGQTITLPNIGGNPATLEQVVVAAIDELNALLTNTPLPAEVFPVFGPELLVRLNGLAADIQDLQNTQPVSPITLSSVLASIASLTNNLANLSQEVTLSQNSDAASIAAIQTAVNNLSSIVLSVQSSIGSVNVGGSLASINSQLTSLTNFLSGKVDKINIAGGTAGTANSIPVINYNTQGQITSATLTPISITPTQAGLGLVSNAAQLTRGANDWGSFPLKTVTDANDTVLIENSASGNTKARVAMSSFLQGLPSATSTSAGLMSPADRKALTNLNAQTVVYVNSQIGSDSTGDGSLGNPYASLAPITTPGLTAVVFSLNASTAPISLPAMSVFGLNKCVMGYPPWVPNQSYTLGSRLQAPNGQPLVATAAFTSGNTFSMTSLTAEMPAYSFLSGEIQLHNVSGSVRFASTRAIVESCHNLYISAQAGEVDISDSMDVSLVHSGGSCYVRSNNIRSISSTSSTSSDMLVVIDNVFLQPPVISKTGTCPYFWSTNVGDGSPTLAGPSVNSAAGSPYDAYIGIEFPTVSAALIAGKRSLLVAENTTELANITITADTSISIANGVSWNLGNFQILYSATGAELNLISLGSGKFVWSPTSTKTMVDGTGSGGAVLIVRDGRFDHSATTAIKCTLFGNMTSVVLEGLVQINLPDQNGCGYNALNSDFALINGTLVLLCINGTGVCRDVFNMNGDADRVMLIGRFDPVNQLITSSSGVINELVFIGTGGPQNIVCIFGGSLDRLRMVAGGTADIIVSNDGVEIRNANTGAIIDVSGFENVLLENVRCTDVTNTTATTRLLGVQRTADPAPVIQGFSLESTNLLELYVASTGNDISGNGSLTNPVGTIQHAIDLLQPFGVIKLGPGVYPNNINISTNNGIKIQGESSIHDSDTPGNGPTVIQGQVVISGSATNVTLENLTFGYLSTTLPLISITSAGSGVIIIRDLELYDNGSTTSINVAPALASGDQLVLVFKDINFQSGTVRLQNLASGATGVCILIGGCIGPHIEVGQGWFVQVAVDTVFPIFTGNPDQVIYNESPGPSSGVRRHFVQTGHGFNVGDAITLNNSGIFVKAQATALPGTVIGVVSEVSDANTFAVTMYGGTGTILSGLTPGAIYYLSGSTPGQLTTTAPSVAIPVMIALSASEGHVFGNITVAGGGGGGGSSTWGSITGTLANQTDLQNVLDSKVDAVSAEAGDYGAADQTVTLTITPEGLVSHSNAIPIQIIPSQAGLGNVSDDAQLKRSAGDYASFPQKTTPVASDIILIEDSAASGAKKYTQLSAIPITTATQSALNSKAALVSSPTAGNILSTDGVGQPIDSGKQISTDSLFTAYSDNLIPTQKAVGDYVASTTITSAKRSVWAATTANVPTTYFNGAAGVGATLTGSSNGALVADGVTLNSVGLAVLVNAQTASAQNGLYTVTTVGNGSSPFVLTRRSDYDTPTEVKIGDTVLVEMGNTLAGVLLYQTNVVSTIGTDPINFSQVNIGSGSLRATNNLSELTPTAATARSNIGAAASGLNTDILGVTLNQTGLKIKDSGSNTLTIRDNETLTAARTFNIITGDADRTLTLTNNATLSGTNTGDETTGTIQTKVGLSSASNTGLLSSTDWSTFNSKQGPITGAASTVVTNNLGNSLAVVTDSSGKLAQSTTTSTQIGYLSNVASDIQTQFTGKQSSISTTVASQAAMLALTPTVGDIVKRSDLGNALFQLTALPASTLANWSQIGGPATGTLANSLAVATDANGRLVTVPTTSTQLGYLSNVTSDIQTQFTGKQSSITTTVASQAAMLALTPAVGDIVKRSDLNNALFQLTALPASTLGNWIQLGSPAALLTTNNAWTGTNSFSNTVTLTGSTTAPAAVATNILEPVTVSATAATGTINIYASTQSVLYYTVNATANFILNVAGAAATTLNTFLAIGQCVTVVFLNTNGVTAFFPTAIQVDGAAATTRWQGGAAPTAGNASSIDAYTITIIKTAAATFTVLASQTRFA